ncbi:MAG TPA: cytochrome bc complex cytochrome b subunit [Candidatus Latescibacteria bacterium]|nr:cytochrome bc complex cytochrome b subunit [Candidatus Latescibacterota bacterium]HJP29789.1 cytochrome bc complex cytochrome b subunit [Candidatus Latescibacterota bacterium]
MQRLWLWFDERLHLEPVRQVVLDNLRKPVPPHVNWLFTLGAALLLLLSVQLLSGVLLMAYYKPTGREAFASVESIMYEVPLGWLVRSIHNWGSHLIVIVALAHMFRVFFYGGFKKPRELTWIVGVGLLAAILGFGFTGYLLPWDQVAYWGTVVATEAPASLPVLGPTTRQFMIGGSEVADATLGRFYVVHVFLLPLLLLGLVGLHLFLIRYQGISSLGRSDVPEPTAEQNRAAGGEPFFPHHFLRDSATMYLTLGVLVTLALLYPAHIGTPADPLSTPMGIKPEWYFLPAYQLLKYVPEVVGVNMPPLLLLVLVLLPLAIDTSPQRHPGRRPRVVAGWLATTAVILLLGVLGHLSETTSTFFGTTYYFDVQGVPHRVEVDVADDEGGQP